MEESKVVELLKTAYLLAYNVLLSKESRLHPAAYRLMIDADILYRQHSSVKEVEHGPVSSCRFAGKHHALLCSRSRFEKASSSSDAAI